MINFSPTINDKTAEKRNPNVMDVHEAMKN